MAKPATRRDVLRQAARGAAAALLPASLPMPAIAQGSGGRVVVVGGGFAGATCARTLKALSPRITVTLVEASQTYTACPFSNAVIAGLRDIKAQQFDYQKIAGAGVALSLAPAAGVDPQTRAVMLANGARLSYDRLVLAPGIELRWDALPGYGENAAERMPHAWKAGDQTLLLRSQLEAMSDGGLVAIAHYLKTRKPKSKLIILDAKDDFAERSLFQSAWTALYPGLIEWVPLAAGGKVTAVEPSSNTLVAGSTRHRVAVANIIPPQKAGRIAELAHVTDSSGWCPVDPVTFESKLVPNTHVIGDAAIMGAMPKTAFAANAQAKVCAAALAKLLAGEKPQEPRLIEASYSLIAPDFAISAATVYRPKDGQLVAVGGGMSAADVPAASRALEAHYAGAWFKTITEEVFG
jgi:NADPH-dependent 2,4-dienoyl-CoA reductase/sulfur reductase-like enzyme